MRNQGPYDFLDTCRGALERMGEKREEEGRRGKKRARGDRREKKTLKCKANWFSISST